MTHPTQRLFIAAALPEHIAAYLETMQSQLRSMLPPDSVRWSQIANLHLTLNFIGDMPEGRVDSIGEALTAVVFEPFELIIGRFGAFPNMQQPRVLWAGIKPPATALHALKQAVDAAVLPFDGQTDERSYTPHLTLGYVRSGVDIFADQDSAENSLAELSLQPLSFAVSDFHLMRSQKAADGPVYTSLRAFSAS